MTSVIQTASAPLVEICVDDLAGVLAAERAGADRVELCADLLEGGTTPSPGMIEQVLESVSRVGVQIMVRARGGDFVYSADEMRVMLADARAIAGLSARSTVPVGIVFGALLPDGRVDEVALAAVIEAAGLPVTFHKAFDETPDLATAYETLAAHGVERVLTSGGAATAAEGAGVLAELTARSTTPGSPRVLVGGSVRAHNVADLLVRTGADEVHLRAQVASERGHLVTDEGIVAETVAAARAAGSSRAVATRLLPDTPPSSDDDPARAASVTSSTAASTHTAIPAVLAIDVGGTSAKGAVVDATGRVRSSLSVATGGWGDENVRRIRTLLVDLAASAATHGLDVVGAGVVSPGLIDSATGTVRYASTLGWTDMPLGRILTDAIGIPVAVGHDVRAAGSAEMAFGSGAGSRDALFASIGTGVAASIVSDGRAVDGAISGAGELGHIPVAPGGEQCTCGQVGCLEVYFSGAGLARRYAAATGGGALTAAEIIARIDSDPIATRVWSEGIDALTTGLATITLLIDPEVVVLGGGVAQAGDTLLLPLRERLSAALAWREAPRITTAALGIEAGRIGAAMLGFRAAHRSEVPLTWTRADIAAPPAQMTSAPLVTPVRETPTEKEEVSS